MGQRNEPAASKIRKDKQCLQIAGLVNARYRLCPQGCARLSWKGELYPILVIFPMVRPSFSITTRAQISESLGIILWACEQADVFALVS